MNDFALAAIVIVGLIIYVFTGAVIAGAYVVVMGKRTGVTGLKYLKRAADSGEIAMFIFWPVSGIICLMVLGCIHLTHAVIKHLETP